MGTSANWVMKTTLGASETEFDDTVFGPTEYEVKRQNFGGNLDYGYASVAAERNLPDFHSTVLLVVDQTQVDPASVGADNAAAMSSKLDRLETDLQGDDWSVVRIDVPRDDDLTTARNNVTFVKQQILNVHTSHPNLKSIFIIGHVPVPYSGINTSYDSHSDHQGAWPADAYYGDFDENLWVPPGNPLQNDIASKTGMRFPENDNLPGDGKLDFDSIPSDGSGDRVEAAVGRVDFSRLYWHIQYDPSLVSESFLLQRYLDKDHAFRTGSLDFVPLDSSGNPLPNKAIIDDEFGPGPGYGIGDAWTNLSALVGPDGVKSARWRSALTTTDPANRYLWAFAGGPGEASSLSQDHPENNYWSSIGQFGQDAKMAYSSDYAGGPFYASGNVTYPGDIAYQAVFNVIFGSWVGDWNYPRSLLRSAVASNGIGLAALWGERPTWFLQSMSAGATLGDVFLKTINNSSNAANGYIGASPPYDHSIAIALMGDPTLRMSYAKSPTWASASFNGGQPIASWDGQSDTFDHFNIYVAPDVFGKYQSSAQTTSPTYTAGLDEGVQEVWYLIRGVKLVQTPTGSYYDQGTGVLINLVTPDGGAPTDAATYDLYQGTQRFNQDLQTTLGSVVFNVSSDASATFNATQHLASLNLAFGAQATMPTGTGVLVTGTLSVDTGGTLDLADNDMIVLDGDAGTWDGSEYTGITGLVAQGRNGGGWDGTGIISSDASTTDDLTMLAVVSAADPFNLSGTQTATFDGETVTATSVIVKFTYGGDANIDGKLNIDDYGRIGAEIGQSGSVFGWYNGDFNYDGKINIDDEAILDGNVGRQGAPL
jgi:hypothetical protein